MGTVPRQGLSLRFRVTLDKKADLGNWLKCDGLNVEYDIFEYREGGENGFVHRLPGRRKYQNIKLTRPLDAQSGEIAKLFYATDRPNTGHTARIEVLAEDGQPITGWDLTGVYVARWSGPTLDIGGKEVASETLELVHNGFLGSA